MKSSLFFITAGGINNHYPVVSVGMFRETYIFGSAPRWFTDRWVHIY